MSDSDWSQFCHCPDCDVMRSEDFEPLEERYSE